MTIATHRKGFADSELLQAIGIGAVWLLISLPIYTLLVKKLSPVGLWPHLGLLAIAAAVPPLLMLLLWGAECVWDRFAERRRGGATRDR